MLGERLGGAEALNDEERLRAQQGLGQAAIEAASESNVINLADHPKWQEYMRNQTDRYGNPAYSEETIANAGGAEFQPPAVVAEQTTAVVAPEVTETPETAEASATPETMEFQPPAVVAEQTTEMVAVPDAGEVAQILNGRTIEQARADLIRDRNLWQSEIEEIQAEGQLTEAQQLQIVYDQAMIAEAEHKIALLANAQMPAEEAPVEVEGEATELVEQAAAGELDLNNPNDVTEQQLRRARFEQVIAEVRDVDLKERLKTELVALERADAERAANEFQQEAEVIDGVAREIDEQAELAEVELSAEEREKLQEEVIEKVKGRTGFKKFMARVAVVAATIVIATSALFGSIRTNRAYSGVAHAAETTQEVTRDLSVDDLNETTIQGVEAQQSAEFDLDAFIEEMQKSGETDLSQHDLEAIGGGLLETMNEKGKTENKYGVLQNRSEHYDSKTKESINAFGEDLSYIYDMKDGREAEMIKRTLAIERDQPETLAAHAADLPNVMRAAGVDESIINIENFDERQKAVDALFDKEGGAELQAKLLGAMAVVLGSSSYDFYLENGTEQTSYIYHLNGNESSTENLVLGTDVKNRNNAKQAQITVTYADGTQEVIDLNLACGDQNNHTPEGKKRTPVIAELTPLVESEPVPIVPLDPVVPPEEITPPEESENPPEESETPPEESENPPEESETPPEESENPPEESENPPEESESPTPSETPGTGETPAPSGTPETSGTPAPSSTPTTPPSGTVKPKDAENEKKVVEDGGQTNPVDKTGNLDDKTSGEIEKPSNETEDNKVAQEEITGNTTGTYDKTTEESATASKDNQQKVEQNMRQDNTANEDEKQKNHEDQAAANAAYEAENAKGGLSDEEYTNYIDQILNKR